VREQTFANRPHPDCSSARRSRGYSSAAAGCTPACRVAWQAATTPLERCARPFTRSAGGRSRRSSSVRVWPGCCPSWPRLPDVRGRAASVGAARPHEARYRPGDRRARSWLLLCPAWQDDALRAHAPATAAHLRDCDVTQSERPVSRRLPLRIGKACTRALALRSPFACSHKLGSE
jgi:hypothetical protein